ncbi:SpoIIE family protein phosphatase [Fuchsiella alkaliacetigena]|uniref:SpoIIE family protein phosphatase n=1 Tax=Fuchsiella alkaliacetigena TaxID=957042 RepID=UPI002009EC83|nr:SpoIIE family protein phosphatase [Fuchsiella alkaliacetigena]MCK8825683.1 SpoIIE family protein phosphatase [Fuchsiella alkaliacetigena]
MKDTSLILIVDDNDRNLRVLGNLLKEESYNVIAVSSGQAALDLIAKKLPDLILLDIMMPDLDGYQVANALSSKRETAQIPIIFISALNEIEDKLKGFEAGGVDFITKPFYKQEVLARVKNHLELRKTKQKLKEKMKAHQRSEKKLKAIFEGAKNVSLVITEPSEGGDEAIIREFSPGAENTFGYQREEVLGEPVSLLHVAEEIEDFSEMHRELREQKEVISKKTELVRKNGERFPALFNVYPFELDGREATLGVSIEISELEKAKKEIEEKNLELKKLYRSLDKQFEKASQLHKHFLPEQLPELKGLDLAAYYKPADRIGGDFYNLIELDNQAIIYIADVTGHGLDGALLNIFLRESINNYLHSKYENIEKDYSGYHRLESEEKVLSPTEIIRVITDRYQQEDFPADYFICLLLVVVDLESFEVNFVNAGFQLPPLLVSKDGELSVYSCGGMPISTVTVDDLLSAELDTLDYQAEKLQLSNGELFFLATDGLVEEMIEGDFYGEERLKNILLAKHSLSSQEIIEAINEDFNNLNGSPESQDDITLLAIKRKES